MKTFETRYLEIQDQLYPIVWDAKKYIVENWKKVKEGYDLQFVGSRPFDVDGELFMKLAKQGQQMLDDAFNRA